MDQIIKLQKAIRVAKEMGMDAENIKVLVKALDAAVSVFKSTQWPMAKQRMWEAEHATDSENERNKMIRSEVLRKFPEAKDLL